VAVYEQHIGVVTPMILAELQRAEAQYPATWVPDAIREAVLANVRSWRYIAKILARWSKDGRGDATPVTPGMEIDVTRYTDGAYGDLFRRGSDTSDLEPLP
jgi:DnaD/phage-associated family protein